MKDGTTARFDCADCSTEFEVTLEPKAKGLPGHVSDDKTVTACPFCGSMSGVTGDDEPDKEDNDD